MSEFTIAISDILQGMRIGTHCLLLAYLVLRAYSGTQVGVLDGEVIRICMDVIRSSFVSISLCTRAIYLTAQMPSSPCFYYGSFKLYVLTVKKSPCQILNHRDWKSFILRYRIFFWVSGIKCISVFVSKWIQKTLPNEIYPHDYSTFRTFRSARILFVWLVLGICILQKFQTNMALQWMRVAVTKEIYIIQCGATFVRYNQHTHNTSVYFQLSG